MAQTSAGAYGSDVLWPTLTRRSLLALLSFGTAQLPSAVRAAEPPILGPEGGPLGRPRVTLNALVVPEGTVDRARVTKVLAQALKREQSRVAWGAGRGSRISYRFYLEQLELTTERGVLRVKCTALGRLPKGKSARSRLEYGGDPRRARETVDHVLQIVARGVLTRLADLENTRRLRRPRT